MGKKHIQDLMEVHKILFKFPVWGESVIPFAQALAMLQNVIQEMDFEIRNNSGDLASEEETV